MFDPSMLGHTYTNNDHPYCQFLLSWQSCDATFCHKFCVCLLHSTTAYPQRFSDAEMVTQIMHIVSTELLCKTYCPQCFQVLLLMLLFSYHMIHVRLLLCWAIYAQNVLHVVPLLLYRASTLSFLSTCAVMRNLLQRFAKRALALKNWKKIPKWRYSYKSKGILYILYA